jgi:hypothetical protein
MLLCPEPTNVICNADYARLAAQVADIESALRDSGIEAQAVEMALENHPGLDEAAQARLRRFAVESVRAEVLRRLQNTPSFRSFSVSVACSTLLARFCGLLEIDGIRRSSKSTMERRSKLFSAEQWQTLNRTLLEVCGSEDLCGDIGLAEPVAMDVCLVDTTCLEANIHFPVDWVLCRDVSMTLLKAIKLIRGAGVLCRMQCTAEQLGREMSKLCIAMTNARRGKDSRRERKRLLRAMKPLLRRIGKHARSHLDKLLAHRSGTRFSERQAARIAERVEEKLGQIELVISQAHERIIGERPVADKDKILSVHEADVHVIVRGKAGRAVEFGNTLFIAENAAGLITDWALYRERAPSEPKQLAQSLKRQNACDLDPIEAVATDRGFSSKATSSLLEDLEAYDACCPRNIQSLGERMSEERFAALQRRRASTEARIAILRNNLLGGRLRAKGYENRARAVGGAVLAHNLWMIARKLAAQRDEEALQAAA